MRVISATNGLVTVVAGLLLALPAGSVLAEEGFVPEPARVKELVHMVRQDCGSCHGLTLNGGLGPALTADALHDKPYEFLLATLYRGRPGTPMPPFMGILTEEESGWIVRQLMAGFPEDGGPLPVAAPGIRLR
jgi:cytochrome c55X